ncbi:MAG: hypothetical protein Q7S13_02130, partial [Candidatus Omnitrophota bacterium]|nr:hypothetical protein [Candidatus Omnitrophota bacterium]
MTKKELQDHYKNQPFSLRVYVLIRMFFFDINRVVSFLPPQSKSMMELACGWGLASFVMAARHKDVFIRSY